MLHKGTEEGGGGKGMQIQVAALSLNRGHWFL